MLHPTSAPLTNKRSLSRVMSLGALVVATLLGPAMTTAALAAPANHRTSSAPTVTNAPDVATATLRPAQPHLDHEPAVPRTKSHSVGKIERAEAKAERKAERSGVGEAGANASSTNYLRSGGGYVQTAPRVYVLFWGTSFWTNQDYYGVRKRLTAFYNGIGGTVWGTELKEYSGYGGAFTNPSSVLKGVAYDSTAVPAHPSQAQVQQAAVRARRYFNDWGFNTQFVVVLPSGHADQVSASTTSPACGWHYWGNDNGYGFTFTSLPYGPDFGNSCGNYKVNQSVLDGTTIVASHEYGETVTDPYGNGWQDSTGISGENGDKCAWLRLANAHFANGAFPVQSLWSNYYRSHYADGCLYVNGF